MPLREPKLLPFRRIALRKSREAIAPGQIYLWVALFFSFTGEGLLIDMSSTDETESGSICHSCKVG